MPPSPCRPCLHSLQTLRCSAMALLQSQTSIMQSLSLSPMRAALHTRSARAFYRNLSQMLSLTAIQVPCASLPLRSFGTLTIVKSPKRCQYQQSDRSCLVGNAMNFISDHVTAMLSHQVISSMPLRTTEVRSSAVLFCDAFLQQQPQSRHFEPVW